MTAASAARGARVAILALAVLMLAAAALAADPIAPFLGRYRGHGIAESEPDAAPLDLDVTITAIAGGFSVAWSTAMRDPAGGHRRKAYVIEFEPAGRPGIFASRMRTNMFGHKVPNDPLRGMPYVWARLRERTLSVYALLITDDGGYEMQVYHRTLAEGGLALKFLRLREGEAVRTVTARLERVGP